MNFEYKGFKYGLSACGKDFFFYSEKIMKQGKPQQKLNADTLNKAIKEVESIIDKKLKK